MKVALIGEQGWERWSTVRDVLSVLGPHDQVFHTGRWGAETMFDELVKKVPRSKRPKVEVYRSEKPRYGDDAPRRRNLQILMVGAPHALVVFDRDGRDEQVPEMMQMATDHNVRVYDAEEFVREMRS